MKFLKSTLYIFLPLLLLNSCRDYVEVEQVGNNRILKYTSDYRAIANNYNDITSSGGIYLIANADVEFPTTYQNGVTTIWGNSYTWQDRIYDPSQGDSDWTGLYKAVYYSNVILDGVMGSEKGTEAEKKEIYAEAFVHRAFAYLQLVNTYGPQFDPASANSEKAVPLLLKPELFSSLDRNTVGQVYDQIISDLKSALDNGIQDDPQFNVLPSKRAVYGLLARTYLLMGQYQLSLENAEKALQMQNGLIDFKSLATAYSYPVLIQNPEVIFSKTLLLTYNGAPLSTELLNSFGTDDLRYNYYTAPGTSFYPTYTGRGFGVYTYSYTNGINIGVSVPEMYLIAAECYARSGKITEAVNYLNILRAKRFKSGAAYTVTATTNKEALDLVLAERRKEFIGRGFRWFDQRRLNLDPAYRKTYTRVFKGQTYTLEPNSGGYVFPINQNYIDLSPELGK
ncbi:RagB/SusD family nutrient uptake outer membrane protein [Flavobacterium quisquiliarum]|uniref:RagB/SusD family nutrient uptake outer membrane protein n=1 Tax=Flavobacterium quisquiliarum TaxID=1834436 RepID=A0ABV8W3E5_9FLAO|nr:RagB/SusD family nutrient uptake outer membrane protein [Flavobacterium quisquiliarum]MBW1654697.1 RagB/SusD family nutrient uptake outer membrane protein [Flavobacterium quisquiliarum]NWL01618.1 RagB/SusD family nutrient uptake outer membrane protein [Flavobacterium collinsii]